jgi:hypothetical protein
MTDTTQLVTQHRTLGLTITNIFLKGTTSRADELALIECAGDMAVVFADLDTVMSHGGSMPAQWGRS